jgi:hypothetical protein
MWDCSVLWVWEEEEESKEEDKEGKEEEEEGVEEGGKS